MNEIEECITRYRRILQLLEEEGYTIERSLKGEVVSAYRKLLTQEMENLQNAMKQLLNYH